MKIFEPLSKIDPLYHEMLMKAISYEIIFKKKEKGLASFNYKIFFNKGEFQMFVRKAKLKGWYGAMQVQENKIPIRNRSLELKHTFILKDINVTILCNE